MNEIVEIHSTSSARFVLGDKARQMFINFQKQNLWSTITVKIGGSVFRGIPSTYKTMIVDMRQEYDADGYKDPEYILVEKLSDWESEKGIKVDYVNRKYQEENIHIWSKSINEVEELPITILKKDWSIKPFEVNDSKLGHYAVYNDKGTLEHIIWIGEYEELFKLMDKIKTIASNFTVYELNELGYLSKADHTSWLGQSGQKVHAVVAYFRELDGKLKYYQLDTWCSGNHWQAHEHSPKPIYPTEEHVTCKKCLKKIIKNQ